jgi:hypothetical protein
MNKKVDENYSSNKNLHKSHNPAKNKFFVYNKSMIAPNPIYNFNLKLKEPSKIIKLDQTQNKLLNNVKIEYSKDVSLLDKLFEMKNTMKIKRKTFI